MQLFEMFDPAIPGFQDLEADESRPQWGEFRQTHLYLRQINKLRRMNDVRNYEHANDLKKIRKQYAPPPAAPGL